VSPGPCPGVGETATFTFSYADQAIILGADGHVLEQGSFTLSGTTDGVRVIDFDSTFSGSSAVASISGERHLGEDQIANQGGVICSGTSDADRFMQFGLADVPTEHVLTLASTGASIVERGIADIGVASIAASDFGHYVVFFERVPDEVFESNEGFAAGGGKVGRSLHVNLALHSKDGKLHGSGGLDDGATRVLLLDLTGLRSDGDLVTAIGTASIDGGEPVSYRLEVVDSTDTFALQVGDRQWGGTLTNGNFVVK